MGYENKKSKLIDNTVMLFIMTVSVQALALVLIPYETRVFGPEVYGKVGLAQAIMSYVQLILDFGFILSATERIARLRNDLPSIIDATSAVMACKVILSVFVVAILGVVFAVNDTTAPDFLFYFVFLLAFVVNSFMPDFLYRGMEEMRPITIRTLVVRSAFTAAVVLFVRSPDQLIMVPFFQLIGNGVALIVVLVDCSFRFQVKVVVPDMHLVLRLMRASLPFFGSRIAGTFYQGFSTIVLSSVYGTSPIIGFYSSADKVLSVVKTASSPIADSLYPYMVAKKNYALVKKVLLVIAPFIVLGAIIVSFFADTLSVFIFGPGYEAVGNILRCLLPAAIVIMPSYIICFPVLVPLGLERVANSSNWLGVIVHLAQLAALYFTSSLTVYSLCIAISVTEVTVFLYRAIAAYLGVKAMIPSD